MKPKIESFWALKKLLKASCEKPRGYKLWIEKLADSNQELKIENWATEKVVDLLYL